MDSGRAERPAAENRGEGHGRTIRRLVADQDRVGERFDGFNDAMHLIVLDPKVDHWLAALLLGNLYVPTHLHISSLAEQTLSNSSTLARRRLFGVKTRCLLFSGLENN